MTRCSAPLLALAVPLFAADLSLVRNQAGDVEVLRSAAGSPIVVQHAPAGMRPYLHPVLAPDGKGVITDFRPSHHLHQTGIYFGLAAVNGRSFFHNLDGSYFRGRGATIDRAQGKRVGWTVVTDWLAADGTVLLTETQRWALEDHGSNYVLDLDWEGRAAVDLTVGEYAYGGLFIRMPWKPGIAGAAVNSEGLSGNEAEGKRARWVDVGMEIAGRPDWAHIAVLDHRSNAGHPVPWRVDGNLGIVPSRSRLGAWQLPAGETSRARYRLVVYTGTLDKGLIEKNWEKF